MTVPELDGIINEPLDSGPAQHQGDTGTATPESGDTDYIDSFISGEGETGQGQPTPEQASEETFYDASKVPPELQATFREMQGAQTQKSQQTAQLRKQYEAGLSQFEGAQKKAQVMDQLLQDPRFQDFINTVDQPQQGTGYQEDALVDPSVQAHLDSAVAPLQRRVDDLDRRYAAGQELAQLAVKRPDYAKYEGEMLAALKQNPSRTLEDAYNAAVINKLDSRRETLRRTKQAQSASVEGAAPARGTAPVTEVNDIYDAFKQARQMLNVSDGELGRMSMKRG